MSNPAGWNCESCRRQRLEARRRCAWLPGMSDGERRVVWARKDIVAEQCPRSLITAASHAWLEMFAVWKRTGGGNVWALSAKDAEAVATLEEQWEKERNDAQNGRQ
jgi:hypothetical protein